MRRGSIFWGLIITIAGILLLLESLDLLPGNFGDYFWPLALILAGLFVLLGRNLFRGSQTTETVSIPLEGSREAEIDLHHGAGKLIVTALDAPGVLLSGTFTEGVQSSVSRSGERARVKLSSPDAVFFPPFANMEGLNWDLGLSRDVKLNLSLHSGANDARLNLQDLNVSELVVETGASSSNIVLPAHAGFTRVVVKAGAASIDLRVPESVAASIEVQSGLSGNNIDSARFPRQGSRYESPNYQSADNKVDIHIESGVGSVSVH
jgi:hypothetical protein